MADRSRMSTTRAESRPATRPALRTLAGPSGVRQTVELIVMLCLCVSWCEHFRRRRTSCRRLDGSDASGLASRDRLPELPMRSSWSASRRKGRPARRSARIAASAGSMTARRSNAAAIACWSRSSSTSFAGPGGGKWPSFIFPASPLRPTSSGWSACPASRSGSRAATSS